MWDAFLFAFNSPIVLPFTILLIAVLAYWALVVFGGLGIDLLDVDWDFDIEADGDPTAGGDSITVGMLKFFHVGEVPIMIIVTVFALAMWVTTYLTSFYLRDWEIATWIPIAVIGPNLLLSLLVTRFVLLPFRTFFRSLHDANSSRTRIIGKVCLITSSEVTEQFGQAEIAQAGPPIVLSVRCRKGDTMRKGDAAIVESYCQDSNTYLVVPKHAEV